MADDTFIDGCGVQADIPLGEGIRIRFKLDENRQQDISVYLDGRKLHIYGMYRPTIITFDTPNHFVVDTMRLEK